MTGRRSLYLLLAAVVLVVVAAYAALAQAQRAGDLRDERTDRREVQRVAGQFGEAYLSYDYQDVDASGNAVRALATESFGQAFESTKSAQLEAVFSDIETTTVAHTTAVYVGDVGETTASAYVVVAVDADNATNGRQTLHGLSFLVALKREGGAWKVDSVSPPPSPDIEGGSSTTTTTVPGAPPDGATTTTSTGGG